MARFAHEPVKRAGCIGRQRAAPPGASRSGKIASGRTRSTSRPPGGQATSSGLCDALDQLTMASNIALIVEI
jgi:hypothetical protein